MCNGEASLLSCGMKELSDVLVVFVFLVHVPDVVIVGRFSKVGFEWFLFLLFFFVLVVFLHELFHWVQ